MGTWKRCSRVLILSSLLVAAACAAYRPPADLADSARSAQTPAERTAAAAGYRKEAARLRAEAARHDELASWWSGLAGGKSLGTGTGRHEQARHCAQFATYLHSAAAEADAVAEGLEEK